MRLLGQFRVELTQAGTHLMLSLWESVTPEPWMTGSLLLYATPRLWVDPKPPGVKLGLGMDIPRLWVDETQGVVGGRGDFGGSCRDFPASGSCRGGDDTPTRYHRVTS